MKVTAEFSVVSASKWPLIAPDVSSSNMYSHSQSTSVLKKSKERGLKSLSFQGSCERTYMSAFESIYVRIELTITSQTFALDSVEANLERQMLCNMIEDY